MPINALINDDNVLSSGFIPEPRANIPSLSELNALSFDYNRKTLLSNSESALIQKQRNNRDDLFYKVTGYKPSTKLFVSFIATLNCIYNFKCSILELLPFSNADKVPILSPDNCLSVTPCFNLYSLQ